MAVLTNSTGANTAMVKSDGSILVSPTDVAANAGFIVMSGEVTTANSGNARLVRTVDVSPDNRLRVGIDSLMWYDQFNHTTLNTYKYQGTTSTMTITQASGFLLFNGGDSTTSGHVARLQTWRNFPIYGNFPTYVEFWAGTTQNAQVNNVIEFGVGYASGTSTPTDGVFFRLSGATSFQGVANFNGAEVTTGDLVGHVPVAGVVYHYLIVIHSDRVEFFKNGEMLGYIITPSTVGTPTLAPSQPLLIREYNSNTVSTAQRFRVSSLSVSQGDLNNTRLWASTMSGMGQSSIVVPDSVAVGFTANYANAAAPVSATLSVTAGGYSTLGGQWQYAAVASIETDYALFAYQVPAGTAAVPGKNLVIRGIRIDSIVTGANVATTGTGIQWGLSVGASAITPATVDSGTAATRQGRKFTLGIQGWPIGGQIGSTAVPIDVNLDAPVVCEPGTHVLVLMRPFLGTATASQVYRGTCLINGYWE